MILLFLIRSEVKNNHNRQPKILLGPLLGNNRLNSSTVVQSSLLPIRPVPFFISQSHPLLEVVTEGILTGNESRCGQVTGLPFSRFVRKIISTTEMKGPTTPASSLIVSSTQANLVSQILSQLLPLENSKRSSHSHIAKAASTQRPNR